MRFIELFAGVGGFRYGLEKTTGYQCVYANEWDKYAASIYRYHWNDGTLHECDIRTVDPVELPVHDLIVGGFPCQAFSIAGKRAGFTDTRGALFFEICRIARTCRTKYLLLENVKGLLNHEGGATFQTIISTLDELGYDCQWQVLNSKNFGVPQNRERVFIIANLRTEPRPQVFPVRQDAEADIVLSTLTARYYSSQANGSYIGYKQEQVLIHTAYQGETREYTDCSPIISTPSGGGHLPMVLTGGHNGKLDDRTLESKAGFYQDGEMRGLPTGKENRDTSSRWGLAQQPINQPSGSMPKLPQCDSQTQDLCDMWEATQVPRLLRQALPEIYEMGESICDKTQSAFTTGSIRRLTPVETERLQAFPDNWTQYGISIHGEQVKISDTQRYKTMGNAVTTSVVTDIAMAINEALGV